MLAQPVRARLGPAGDQVVDVIVDHGYRPRSIVARAGVPLRLVFRRRDADACTDRVVFSSPHLDRPLARGRTTTIVLPPQPPGEIRFTCGMGRYRGHIELKADGAPLFAELRAAVGRRLDSISTFVRGPARRSVGEDAVSIPGVPAHRGEISQEEFERARTGALAGHRESGP